MSKALKLQRGPDMKRFTAVFLATLSLAAFTGCGLEADETIDENGEVRKVSQQGHALTGSGPAGKPSDPNVGNGGGVPLPPLSFVPPANNGADGAKGDTRSPYVNPRDPGLFGLPQDPIPLFDPAKPRPPGGVDPRVGG